MTAAPCSFPSCRNATKSPSGRCFYHRGLTVRATEAVPVTTPMAPPTPSTEQWVPGTVHPTGGYDQIVTAGADEAFSSKTVRYREGRLHCGDGPAAMKDLRDGRRQEEWWVYGNLSRIDGPALRVFYPDDGASTDLLYFLRGVEFDSLDDVHDELAAWPEEYVRAEIENSTFAPLLAEGHSGHDVTNALATGIETVEGVRAHLTGAPYEWVRGFETAERP